ncbi:hypothetical protein [Streptomyces sp. NPDC059957]
MAHTELALELDCRVAPTPEGLKEARERGEGVRGRYSHASLA